MSECDTIRVCILSSTSYGHVESGYQNGAWAVHRKDVGGVRCRAERLIGGTPCIFYVSKKPTIWGEGFFCGPGVILDKPCDDFANEHAALFPYGNDWCLGFPVERLASGVAERMEADAIRKLRLVTDGRGNYSQDLHLAGRCIFLPCDLPIEDCRTILGATGAFEHALDVWKAAPQVGVLSVGNG